MKKIENKVSELVAAATIKLLRPYKDHVLTFTADNGKEFVHHEKVAKAPKCGCYFAHFYTSWERSQRPYRGAYIYKRNSR